MPSVHVPLQCHMTDACLLVCGAQIYEGTWYKECGKVKRKSSQYFEVSWV